MARTKKKAVKKKTAKKAVKKAVNKTAKKATARKPAGGLTVQTTPALEARLNALAAQMGKTLDQLLVQALSEFAETWEDHQRTVAALNSGDDRMQLVVRDE